MRDVVLEMEVGRVFSLGSVRIRAVFELKLMLFPSSLRGSSVVGKLT